MNARFSRAAAAADVEDIGRTTRAVTQQRYGAPDVVTLTRGLTRYCGSPKATQSDMTVHQLPAKG